MRGRRIAVECAADSLIAVTIHGRRIVGAHTVSVLDGGIVGAPLVGRFELAPVHIAVSDPEIVHRVLQLPPMTARERREVVRREVLRDGETPGMTAWHVEQRIEVDGLPKDEILVVLADGERLQQAIDPLVATNVVPRVVVTGASALIAAARAVSPTPLDRPTALVHWGSSTLTIVVMSGGGLKFARVIEPPAAGLDPFNWIPVEIERSIRHYTVFSKGERVEQVLLSIADAEAARRIFSGGELSERLRLTVTNLNALMAPLLPATLDENMAAGAFTLAYGAALVGPADVPNLRPESFTTRVRSRTVIAASAAATVLAAALIAWSTLSLQSEIRSLRTRMANQAAARRAVQAQIDEQSRAESERARMRQVSALMTSDPLRLLPPSDALLEIARLTPADVKLERVTLGADAQGYALSIVGLVEEDDLTDAQHILTEFYYALRASPLLAAVQMQDTGLRGPAAADPQAPAPVNDHPPRLGFSFAARVKKLS